MVVYLDVPTRTAEQNGATACGPSISAADAHMMETSTFYMQPQNDPALDTHDVVRMGRDEEISAWDSNTSTNDWEHNYHLSVWVRKGSVRSNGTTKASKHFKKQESHGCCTASTHEVRANRTTITDVWTRPTSLSDR